MQQCVGDRFSNVRKYFYHKFKQSIFYKLFAISNKFCTIITTKMYNNNAD